MKIKLLVIFIFLSIQSFYLSGQADHVIYYGDSVFMERVTYFDGSKSSYWTLKENLPKGSYLVIEEHPCGIDTLMKAQFSETGIKDGIWIEWQARQCFVEQELDSDEIINTFWSDYTKSRQSETHYSNNYILQYKGFHFQLDVLQSLMTYGDTATHISEWTNHKMFSIDGKLEKDFTYNALGQLEYSEFFDNGQVSKQGKFGLLGEVIEDWFYFYKDGTIKARGAFTEYTESLSAPSVDPIEDGLWKYYNQDGLLVAEVNFDAGEVIHFKKYLKEKIALPGIEALIQSVSSAK